MGSSLEAGPSFRKSPAAQLSSSRSLATKPAAARSLGGDDAADLKEYSRNNVLFLKAEPKK